MIRRDATAGARAATALHETRFAGAGTLLLCALLGGCATTPSPQPPAPWTRSGLPLPDAVATATTFAHQQHDRRLAALTVLLDRLGLAWQVIEFANRHPERDPRGTGRNVVVELGDPAAERAVVVGAHYDAARLQDGRYADGMLDNAAGSVVLAHVARTLAGLPLRHRLRVVFFDLEEAGLLGSEAFVASLDPANIAAMVNLDVHGHGDTLLFGPTGQSGSEAIHDAMRRSCAAQRFECIGFPAYPPSDDRSFQRAGIANISIAALPAIEAHQLWLLMNGGRNSGLADGFMPAALRTIHSAGDTVERLDPDSMTLGHDAAVALLLELDRTLE